jgi:hypothetical protein
MPDSTIQLRKSRTGEAGAATILVTLMLLVLLTIWAASMAKNSLREAIITGTSRQGAATRDLTEAGIDWSIYWMMDDLTGTRSTPTAGSGAYALRAQKSTMVAAQQTGILSSAITNADMTLPAPNSSSTLSFQVFLTYMGNPVLPYTQTDVHASSISAASMGTVQLWALRSDGYMTYTGGPTFINRQEAWITLPPSAQQ